MADISLPQSGQLNWDIPLNAALNTVDTDALSAQTNITNHTSNVPADPHGDRAYANSLVSPITSGTNLPNGYVKLDGTGHIPASLIAGTSAGGMYTKVFDAVGLYGMHADGSDTSSNLQNALNAAASAGGGIVYVGPGVYSLGNYVVIGSNTWLLLSEGAVLQRIQGVSNPPYIVSNVQFGTSNTPSTNFKISGGKLDAVGTQGLGSACTPIFVIQATKVEVRDIWINNVFNNPAVELNGVTVARVDFCHFTGTGNNFSAPTVPAIRLNTSETTTTPTGLANSLYNGSVCNTIKITDCDTGAIVNTTNGSYGRFCGTDLVGVQHNQDITVTACSTKYNSTGFTPVDFSNWINFSIDNCNFFDSSSASVGTEWSPMTLKNSFSVANDISGNAYPPAYRMLQDGALAIRGSLSTPNGGNVTEVTFATLPVAYAATTSHPPTACVIQASGNHQGSVSIDQSGNLQIHGNFANNNTVYIDSTLRV